MKGMKVVKASELNRTAQKNQNDPTFTDSPVLYGLFDRNPWHK